MWNQRLFIYIITKDERLRKMMIKEEITVKMLIIRLVGSKFVLGNSILKPSIQVIRSTKGIIMKPTFFPQKNHAQIHRQALLLKYHGYLKNEVTGFSNIKHFRILRRISECCRRPTSCCRSFPYTTK